MRDILQNPILYHIPVCPFSQRLAILLHLKGHQKAVTYSVIDITRPRDPEFLRKTRGSTALPVLEFPDGRILKESLVILSYFDETIAPQIARSDPYERAVEQMMVSMEGPFTMAGYMMVMNQDRTARSNHLEKMRSLYRDLNGFLMDHNPDGVFLFDQFGLAEAVFTPMFMRFWFLDYYEGFELPEGEEYDRVRRWRDACLSHPAAQQVSREEIVKLYFDYALGAGNGALVEGRNRSSFVFEPHWQDRPWPPRDKYAPSPSDADLGLI
ncbi:glutathione S-transferase family protein [Aliiroseovarius sp. KMU-50]|uniref:Glutathione S-transferase family protein n=1 Tax=Aliiroseovarius salicola TaxID=3009082 RepID=A0ABT4W444_9RHOB|nr:glutathione S-transferase family protein [Aliiroseovarius sp. KMU-50]MDA5095194.1 glutathione S-transferase family protein [Aliiroseovarius sp. KMU-50]